jgi:hypothetical protein
LNGSKLTGDGRHPTIEIRRAKAETIRFIGHVFPRGVLLNAELPDLDWIYQEGNATFSFKTKINNSTINVECSVETYRDNFFNEAYKRAIDLTRTACGLATFALGEGFVCVLEFVIMPNGVPVTLRFNDPNLSGLTKSYSLNPTSENYAKFQQIAQLIVTDPKLLATLHDLTEVVAIPHLGAVNAGRVVDSIRRQMFPSLKDAPAWQAMQRELNVSREYQEYISRVSKGPRHGERMFVSGQISQEVVRRAWVIFDRFLEYLRRGSIRLTDPEFPELN